jgi:hypothetical protein
VGHVRVLYDDTYFDCDSAYNFEQRNQLEAYGRVKVTMPDGVTLTCKLVKYDANTRIANAYKNIVLTDKKVRLLTEHLIYYRTENYGKYPNKGKLIDSTTTLTSDIGYYFPDRDMAYFRHNVDVTGTDFNLKSDSLGYHTKTKMAYLYAPTQVRSKDGDLNTNSGEYNTQNRVATLFGENKVIGKDYTLWGDTLYFDNARKFGTARGNVRILSNDSTLEIRGQYGQFDDSIGISYVTRNPLAMQFDKQDTLFIRADTLYTIENKQDSSRIFRAFRHVRFARNDIQGRADSLVYFYKDSTMHLYLDPVLWSDSSQITGDTMYVFRKNGAMDSMWIGKNSFILSREDTVGYNQVKGKQIRAKFRERELYRVNVLGNAESIYYAKNDEKKTYDGVNKATCSDMTIWFKNQKANRVKFNKQPEGVFQPMFEVIFTPPTLENMKWRSTERPSKKQRQ